MGAWRTLHFFDHETFIREMSPKLRDLKFLNETFENPYFKRYLKRTNQEKEKVLTNIYNIADSLNDDLKTHPELFTIETAKKQAHEKYDAFSSKKYRLYEAFISKNNLGIEAFEYFMNYIIFSTYADFIPYFRFGKSLLESFTRATKNSISEELLSRISGLDYGSIYERFDDGIMTWLSYEEVELFYLDSENIIPKDKDCMVYVNEFKIFIKYAYDNKLGLIAMKDFLEPVFGLKSKISSFENYAVNEKYNFIHFE
ncbi:hypothetical protein [Tenacibaculum sp. M341]|uniref:hypothetical protein n=1 Tax=Tenacibaculum sp. M341 TaxID=2530339 RepID=UPI0010443392|nr:hypothetical protein [Tenacibaculum sp. M341]TCI90951.1 hypothetical protein EYW44_11400 [Tenacibaculum sp. M341]